MFDDVELRETYPELAAASESGHFQGYSLLAGRSGLVTADHVGYEPDSVNAEITAGGILAVNSAFGSQPPIYEAVVGHFDSEAIRRATATCDTCGIERETISYGGIEYFAWGADLQNHLRIRLTAPLFDEMGRSIRLAFTDSYVMRSTSSAAMEEMIDASTGKGTSLADKEPVKSTVVALVRFHPFRVFATNQTICRPYGKALIDESYPDPGPRRDAISLIWDPPPDQVLLRRYSYLAIGTSEVRGQPITSVALWSRSPEVARDNATRLRRRLENTTTANGQPWSTVVDHWDVSTTGSVTIATLYGYDDPLRLAKYEPLLFWEGD